MIVYCDPTPTLREFKELMEKTDRFLNQDAQIKGKAENFRTLAGTSLEKVICCYMQECAKHTAFNPKMIEVTPDRTFPDIIACGLYGVEVKSTIHDKWTTTGSSILESTRPRGIERIYLTFGKLSKKKVEFISRPYEECMAGIEVTHMPRYKIDMRLEKGQTIFDKMELSYDALCKSGDPVEVFKNRYRKKILKPGEKLWWLSDSPPILKFWKDTKRQQANEKIASVDEDTEYKLIAYGLARYVEIFRWHYDEYAYWLFIDQGVICTNIRDKFSSGGKANLKVSEEGEQKEFPAVFGRVEEHVQGIIYYLSKDCEFDGPVVSTGAQLEKRIGEWIEAVVAIYKERDSISKDDVRACLRILFSKYMS